MATRLQMDDWPPEIPKAATEASVPVKVDVIWRVPELDDPEYPELATYCVHSKYPSMDDCSVEFTRIIDGEPYVPGPDVVIPVELYELFSAASHNKSIYELNITFGGLND